MQGYLQYVLLLSCEGNTEQKAHLLCPQALQKGGGHPEDHSAT